MGSVSTALEEGLTHQTIPSFQPWLHRAGAFSDEARVLSSPGCSPGFCQARVALRLGFSESHK